MFRCLDEDFEVLSKKIKHITKKLDKYNLHYNFEVIGETYETINIFNEDGYKLKKVGETIVKVINYEFSMDEIELGDYDVIAVLDHTVKSENNNNNMVYIVKEGSVIDKKYETIDGHCDHCKINRKRNKTVILQDMITGDIKQVGVSCLKEYTGINDIDIIKNFTDIQDIINGMNDFEEKVRMSGGNSKYIKVKKYLAKCISLIEKDGYKKSDTKYDALKLLYSENDIEEYIKKADEVIEYFKNKNYNALDNNFMYNLRIALLQEVMSGENGFVAYAYVAYKKELDKDIQKELKIKNQMGYYGNIGDKIVLKNVKVFLLTSYETSFDGYHEVTTRIYKLINEDNYVFIWKTANFIDGDEVAELKGTIKNHSEYNNEYQTELTRCRIK
jgi:hypothetical protein